MENLQTDLSVKAETNLYYDLFIPENSAGNAPLMIAVHGYGANKRHMMREALAVASNDFVIASVQGPHQHFRRTDAGMRTGFGWLTDHKPEESVALHHKFLLDVIERLDTDGVVDRSKIFLYGFSQSCALNFRFSFTYPHVARGVIGVSGGIPGDLDTNPKYRPFEADTFYLYGDEDEFYPLEKFESFEGKLRERLPNFRSKKYSAEHAITEEMRDDIRAYFRNSQDSNAAA